MSNAAGVCITILRSAALVVLTMLIEAKAEPIQTPAQFEFALRHKNYLLEITVVDDRSGESSVGCARVVS
jgi:hypothetical protein